MKFGKDTYDEGEMTSSRVDDKKTGHRQGGKKGKRKARKAKRS